MKGLWVMWYDYEIIDKAIAAGIDTLLINAFDLPKEPASNHFDSYDRLIECLTRYKDNKDIKKYIVPLWNRPWVEIPADQQMFWNGAYHKHTACIANYAYLASRINPAVEIYKMGLCDGIIWDVEEYGRGTGKDIIEFFSEKNKCECINCTGLSVYTWEQQWRIHQYFCKKLLKDVPVNGHMPSREVWGLQRYPNDVLLMLETTYGGITPWQTAKLLMYQMRNKLLYGLNYTLCPGLWIEALPYDDFFKNIGRALNIYGGYWIFAQRIFSRYSKCTAQSLLDSGCVNTEVVDDAFFERLKEINSTKYIFHNPNGQ